MKTLSTLFFTSTSLLQVIYYKYLFYLYVIKHNNIISSTLILNHSTFEGITIGLSLAILAPESHFKQENLHHLKHENCKDFCSTGLLVNLILILSSENPRFFLIILTMLFYNNIYFNDGNTICCISLLNFKFFVILKLKTDVFNVNSMI